MADPYQTPDSSKNALKEKKKPMSKAKARAKRKALIGFGISLAGFALSIYLLHLGAAAASAILAMISTCGFVVAAVLASNIGFGSEEGEPEENENG